MPKKIKFEVFGPIPLERDGHKLAKGSLAKLWSTRLTKPVGEDFDARSLGKLVGVYVITVESARSGQVMPWYVGQTSKQSFKRRLAQQEVHFRQVLDEAGEGSIQLYLLPMKVPGSNRYRRPTSWKEEPNIAWLEKLLIGICFEINPKLVNVSSRKKHERVVVPGVLNSQRLVDDSERSFAQVFAVGRA